MGFTSSEVQMTFAFAKYIFLDQIVALTNDIQNAVSNILEQLLDHYFFFQRISKVIQKIKIS